MPARRASDPAAVQVYQNQARAALVNRTVTPYAAMQDALLDALYGDTVRRGPLPLEQIEQFDPERAMAIYRERFADMSDFTFTFVGNVEEAQIRRLAQSYLGALPGGGREESGRDVAPMRWSNVVERTVVKGQEEQSLVQLVFAGPISMTQASAVQLDALEALLTIRLREDLREARSGTYTPFVASNLSVVPAPQYQMWVEFGADPQRVDELVEALFGQIASLQESGPSPAELAKVQEQLRRNRQEALARQQLLAACHRVSLHHARRKPGGHSGLQCAVGRVAAGRLAGRSAAVLCRRTGMSGSRCILKTQSPNLKIADTTRSGRSLRSTPEWA